jgi:hypothetical protein
VHLRTVVTAHGIDDESWPAFAAALRVIGDGRRAAVVHTYFGDAGPLIGRSASFRSAPSVPFAR